MAARGRSGLAGLTSGPEPKRVTFVLDLFHGERDKDLSHASLRELLDCLFKLACLYLRAHPEAPDLYDAGVRYQEEPPGAEDWQDVPTTLRLGFGDCLLANTPVSVVGSGGRVDSTPLASVVPGDRIVGHDGEPVLVTEAAVTGLKDVISISLSNDTTMHCTSDHLLVRDTGAEVRATDVLEDDRLMALRASTGFHAVRSKRAGGRQPVACVKTTSGRFYLPTHDLVVHNCEDVACWLAAELVVRYGVEARPDFTHQVREDGSYLYHIVVRLPDGRTMDPSRFLGMR
jgi:hypothetical protein